MNNNGQASPQATRHALIRLLIVVAVVVGFVFYAYGWTVTEVDLDKPQEAQRQENVGNALRELLSPRIFSQEREVVEITAPFLMVCESSDQALPESVPDPETGGVVTINPSCGEAGDIIEVTISNFSPLADTRIRWIPPEGQSRPREDLITGREELVLDSSGSFTGQIEVPRIRDTDGQMHQVAIRAAFPAGAVELSDISQLTVLRMIETIFMALLATSIAIPIASLISFFAARNLMRPIRLPVGKLFVALLFFSIGAMLGASLLNGLGAFAVRVGGGEEYGVIVGIVAPVIVVGLAIAGLRYLNPPEDKTRATIAETSGNDYVKMIVNAVLLTLLVIFAVGALAGFFVWLAGQLQVFGDSLRPAFLNALEITREEIYPLNPLEWLQNATADGIQAIGTLLHTIGTLVILIMPIVAAVITGVSLSNVASNLTTGPLRNLTGSLERIVGGILGALVGAILFAVLGFLGMSAALFGLLVPIVAAIITGNIFGLVYKQFAVTPSKAMKPARSQTAIMTVLFWIGAVLAFVLTFNTLNVGRAIIDGTLPPTTTTSILGAEIYSYMVTSAGIGFVLCGIAGLLVGTSSNYALGSTMYNLARTALNTIRSIEPLIMGLVFVVWVGIGPFAGVLALTLHSIAALGKLYSEQVENIDAGPVEAIQSTGAGWLQTVVFAVIPQIIPPYIAFTMYRWDINVRMSTIIGFVGGGGIGLLLQQQINLLRYRDAGVAVLAIAVVVSFLDYTSAYIREKLT